MKKIMTVVALLGAVAVSQADISINFFTDFGISDKSDAGGNVALLAGGQQALVQLIYAGANGIVDGQAGIGGTVTGDDVVIGQFLSPVAVVGDFATEFAVWGNVIVESLGIAGGNVFGRVFQDSNAAAGSWYYQGHIAFAPNLNLGAEPKPLPNLDYNLGLGEVALADLQVIPEPATIGLMGIAGLGMFLARRKARR